jgi:hypothetical protein
MGWAGTPDTRLLRLAAEAGSHRFHSRSSDSSDGSSSGVWPRRAAIAADCDQPLALRSATIRRAQPGRSSLTRSVSRTPCPHRPVTTHLSPCHRPSVTQGRQLCAWLADHRSSQRCLSNTKARRPRALELSLLAASWRSVSTFSGGTAAKEHDGPTAACGSRSKADPRSPVAPRTGPYDDLEHDRYVCRRYSSTRPGAYGMLEDIT